MIYMICYDISDPKRLRRVASVLENHGIRVQKSFFQCELTERERDRLVELLTSHLDRTKDRLSVYPICRDCARDPWRDGNGQLLKLENFEIL